MLLADGVWRTQTHNCTKFRQNRPFRCGDIAIFWIFKMAADAILDFLIPKILLILGIQRVEMHLHAKFCQNRSIGCEDIKIFRFYKMAAAAIWIFKFGNVIGWRCLKDTDAKLYQISSKSAVPLRRYCDFLNIQDGRRCHLRFFLIQEILLIVGIQRGEMHLHAKFCQNRSIGCEDIKTFRFYKMAAAAIWIFKFKNVIGRRCLEGLDAWLYQISSKAVLPLRRYCNVLNFRDGCRRRLGFVKRWHFIGNWLERIETHHRAYFC